MNGSGFLEVSFWFLVCYQNLKQSCNYSNGMALKQRRRGEDLDMQLYTNEPLI